MANANFIKKTTKKSRIIYEPVHRGKDTHGKHHSLVNHLENTLLNAASESYTAEWLRMDSCHHLDKSENMHHMAL